MRTAYRAFIYIELFFSNKTSVSSLACGDIDIFRNWCSIFIWIVRGFHFKAFDTAQARLSVLLAEYVEQHSMLQALQHLEDAKGLANCSPQM